MERRVIRRETEKNYVTKWEKARVENHKFQFGSKELEQRRKIADLQTELRASKTVDSENTKYLDYSINVSRLGALRAALQALCSEERDIDDINYYRIH